MVLCVDLCAKHNCQMYARCQVQSNKPVCVCPVCNDDSNPVCGSDGVTYANVCNLKATACKYKREILIAKEKPCGKYQIISENDFSISCRSVICVKIVEV